MNWEESKALTPLKRDFLNTFFERSQTFFLTGGSALGIFYLQHRLSYDMDFFTTIDNLDWHLLENDVLDISRSIAARCKSITASPLFHRFELTRDKEHEILDFVVEVVPQIDAKKEHFGNLRVDTIKEIMINKICMLAARCEVKDLVDLYFLEKHGFTFADHFKAARRKESGLDPAMISFILANVKIDRMPDYLLEQVDLSDFKRFVNDLREKLANMSFPEG